MFILDLLTKLSIKYYLLIVISNMTYYVSYAWKYSISKFKHIFKNVLIN